MGRKNDVGGRAVISKGEIVIRVPIDALQVIADGAYALHGLPCRMKVTNKNTFAREIVRSINREDEQGTTPFHKMFDAAMEHAIDQGAEGVEDHPEQDF